MADRITINAGGRRFETSTTTLIGCGAGYFEALLGETGQKLRGRKRARAPEVTGAVDDDDTPGAPREMFIDRDPDVFADVLRYMRANRLPAAAAADTHRLEDLKTEAEFLCYDALVAACDEALEALERARPAARCLTFHVEQFHDAESMTQNLVEVDVPKGQVFFVTSAIPIGGNGDDAGYRLLATNKRYDGEGVIVIVQGSRDSAKYDNRPGAGFTMGGGAGEKVCLHATGADFWVIAWVGNPSKIPGLGATKD